MINDVFSLDGKKILITGSSSGIGRAIAIECSKRGAELIITGRDKIRLLETFNLFENQEKHQLIAADFENEKDLSELVNKITNLSGIVHSAGYLKKQPFKYLSDDSLNKTLETNFLAPVKLTKLLFKSKKINNEASIVFITSIAVNVASYGNAGYMASKGALTSISRAMALELSEKKIRVNCIEPALVLTNLTSALTIEDLENYKQRFPLGRFGLPEEIAYGAIYFLSDASKWTTGISLKIDGGVTLR